MTTGARPENDGTATETDDKHDDLGFQPQLTPMEMLELGVFGGWYFEGDIDEVAIYLRALTPQEVKKNYNVDSGDTNVDFIGKLAMTWGRIKNK